MKWTQEERERVVELHSFGHSTKYIAEQTGRTCNSIGMMLHRAGAIRNKPWTTKRIELVRILHKQGRTDRQIGLVLKKSKYCIYQQRRKMGLCNERKMDAGAGQSATGNGKERAYEPSDCEGYAAKSQVSGEEGTQSGYPTRKKPYTG